MRRMGLGLCLALALTACAADEPEAQQAAATERPAVQMNDVSILWPLPTGEEGDLLLGPDGMLTAEAYEAAFGAPGSHQAGGTPAAPALEALRLVAMRIDPCAGAIHDRCQAEVRLVFQPVRESDAGLQADDSAVHAFYALDADALAATVERMVELRRAGGDEHLGPLAPHPRMVAEGLSGNFATGLAELVREVATPDRLHKVTLMTNSAFGKAWNFSGVDFGVDGEVTRVTMAHLPAGTEVASFFVGFQGDFGGEPPFSPATVGPDDLQLLGNEHVAGRATDDEREEAFAALLRIEDPSQHDPETTDCASCHAAQPIRQLVAEAQFGFVTPSLTSSVLPADDLAQLHGEDATVNLHMFSYKGRTASIHRRTVAETAAVIGWLSR